MARGATRRIGAAVILAALLGGLAWLAWPALVAPAAPPAGPRYGEAQLRRVATLRPVTATGGDSDPYAAFAAHPERLPPPPAGAVCAVRFVDAARSAYRLADYPSAAAAVADGAKVTHAGGCGTCSDLRDLAVYLRRPDLTTPVRRCALLGAVKPLAMACLRNLGFTPPCAETWYFNARNTGRRCLAVCLRSWAAGQASNRADGSLNPCLACDEAVSGPVFKRAAGRTRRNSGIASSIGRGAGEVFAVTHDY